MNFVEDKDFSQEAEEHLQNLLNKPVKKPKKVDERPTEYVEQKNCVKYLRNKGILHWSTPNEAERNITTLKRLEATGLKAGISDLTIMLKNKLIFVEMKREQKILKNGLKSKSKNGLKYNQEEFIRVTNEFNYCEAYVCNGYCEFELLMSKLIGLYN